MAKNGSKRGLDEQLLEGGGGGGRGAGGRSLDAEFYMPAGGAALVGAGLTALGAKNDAKREREAAAEIKRESRGMAKGGSASARADGCCVKGKTKGRMV